MPDNKKLIEWRSEEIAKILLRKCSFELIIEPFPKDLFDLFIFQANNPRHCFAVEVKSKKLFTKRVNQQLFKLVKYRNSGMITIPALLMRIDEANETGEVDFLVVPSVTGKLLIKRKFDFKPATGNRIDLLINNINRWWEIDN